MLKTSVTDFAARILHALENVAQRVIRPDLSDPIQNVAHTHTREAYRLTQFQKHPTNSGTLQAVIWR